MLVISPLNIVKCAIILQMFCSCVHQFFYNVSVKKDILACNTENKIHFTAFKCCVKFHVGLSGLKNSY